MEFEKAYQSLNDAQRAAVDYIDGPLLVIAGPGTGKTQLLSVRVANILKQTDVNPENILCLTFTETGADNMRHRLTDFIGPEAYKVQIQTYHGFGSYLLQEHRPDLKSAIDDLEQFTLIREIQSTLNPTDILRPDYQTKSILQALSDLKSAALDPDDIRKIVNRNQIDNGLIYSAISEDIQQTKQRYPASLPYYRNILEALKTFVDNADGYIAGKVEPIAKIYYRSLAEILLAETDTSIAKPLGAWRAKYFEKNSQDQYIFSDDIANKKLLSLANIMEAYENKLTAAGLFDYDDMILNAIDLLEHDDEKRFNAQERFQYILLDEFQDTNDAQSKLVKLLTDNPSNDGKPNIMAVGDDDQAIYGFQGANTSNFFDFDEHYHPKQIFLTKNYRSSKPILDFAHNIIELGEDRFCKSPNVNIDKQISAENPPAETAIELREFKAAGAEYSYVARRIHELVINQHVPGNKIAIIAPKHKYLISILPYLHDQGVQVSYTRRENILENPEILEIFNFCSLILGLATNPKLADPLWFQTLSLPCWQLSHQENIELIQTARKEHRTILEQMQASDQEPIKAIADYCVDLASKVNTLSAEYFIDEICAKFYHDADNYQLFSNLNTLRDLLTSKQNQKISLQDFCNLIAAHQAAEIPILDKSPYHESETAVQLQTVHSAKGLEYDYVFLIAADNKNWSEAKGNTDKITLPRNLEYVRHTGDSADEKIRVFFVAITRAKANLCLTYSLSDFAGHNVDRLKYLDERESTDPNTGEKVIISKLLPEAFSHVIQTDATEIEPADISPDKWFDDYLPTDEVKKNLLLPLVAHYRLSPTHLNQFIDLRYDGGPENFVRTYLIRVPAPENFALNYGKYIHEVMDELNKEKFDNATALARFAQKIDEADAEPDEKADLKKRGEVELAAFLAARGDALRAQLADSECNFSADNIVIGGAQITGKIDRVEINEASKTITVADFKTSQPKAKWTATDNTFTYKIQLYFYKFLLENSRKYRNYKITHGRIDYISPNKTGEISALDLDFDGQENAEIKHLIEVVFRHIKTLDLPDTTAARQTTNPTKAFYDQLIAEP